MNRFTPYMNWLEGISILLERPVFPSRIARELFELGASCEDAVIDYADEL